MLLQPCPSPGVPPADSWKGKSLCIAALQVSTFNYMFPKTYVVLSHLCFDEDKSVKLAFLSKRELKLGPTFLEHDPASSDPETRTAGRQQILVNP